VDAPPYTAAAVDVVRLPDGRTERDRVAVEEPLEIRIGGRPVAVTMRTPGHDEELALGFCVSEGLQPASARMPDDLAANTVDVEAPGFDASRLQRNFFTTSSCGVCGKGALEAVAVEAPQVESALQVPLAVVAELPDRLREAQAGFAATGGLHATGLFSAAGELLCAREDVGRHNAMDKAVGWAFTRDLLPLVDSILCVSGRLSFELVQKAAVAGCHALRLRARRNGERLHRGVADNGLTGILLVGGASTRFGSPKALALLGEETLAERAWRVLGEGCDERIAVGKWADALDLPFPVLDDGSAVRASLAGVVAGLRAAAHEIAVILPVDVPLVTAELLSELAAACRDAAVTQTGPLPCAYRRTALPLLEARLAAGELKLGAALAALDTVVVHADPSQLVNVNTPEDLAELSR
jgi:FdhD protein